MFLLSSQRTSAVPLIAREATTLGKFNFQATTGISLRQDWFGSPENRFETVIFPFAVRLGLANKLDIGLRIRHLTQRIVTPNTRFTGSLSGYFSPEIKMGLTHRFSLLGIYHLPNDNQEDDLPLTRGKDFELVALYTVPSSIKMNLNAGYVWKGHFNSNLGIRSGATKGVNPGNIFLLKGALEFPIKFHLALLTELAYYNVDDRVIEEVTLTDSAGNAMDALVGLTWKYKGWDMGAGVGFGLLGESHTSFELDRGAGDIYYEFSMAYKLKPRKPDRWD